MASFLHRLGRWCAQHAWATVGAWLAILLVVGGAAATFSKPLTNEFSIPGSRFEAVLEQLKEELPAAAGGTGTVVFSSDDPFTDAQRSAIDDIIVEWRDLEGINDVTNPFETQQQLDSTTDQLDASQEELVAGQAQLEEGQTELDAGQAEIDAGREQIAEQQAQLDASGDALGEQALAAAQGELDAASEELDQAQAELDEGQAQADAGAEQIDAGLAQIDAGRRLATLTDGLRFVSEDGDTAVAQVTFSSEAGSIDPDISAQLPDTGTVLADDDVEVTYSAEIVQDFSSIAGPGEAIGVAIAAIVLLVMLGSLVAAGLPLIMALVGVGAGIGTALAFTTFVEMNSTAPVLALMLGLAVGIDYSLFLLNRHRNQLKDGMPLRASIALATGTSGNAVAFAGLTVIIALAALFVTGIPFLTVMGFAAAGTVAVAVLVALTLTPAALSLVGARVLPKKQRGLVQHDGAHAEADVELDEDVDHQPKHHDEANTGWAAGVVKRPILTIVGVLAIVAGLAFPTLDLRLGLPDGSAEPAESTAYQTYDSIRDNFGAGVNGPLLGVAELDEPLAEGDLPVQVAQADLGEALVAIDNVEYVAPIGVSDDRQTLAFQIVPSGGPSEESTVQLVSDLDAAGDEIGAANDATIGFTGQTVANIDISNQLGDALPIYLLVVLGLSLILLLLVFRSIVIPLLATAGFLLSLAAAFGVVVAVYQWGFLSSIFGVTEPGPILSFLPILLIGVLFGLAMDYQVFLVSAMREMKVHGASAHDAIVKGFNHSARVVVAAAIIMISVFSGFIFAELAMIRPVGLGMAVGVLIDAFLIRMTLTPAVMALLGEKAWFIPKWLDKALPDVDVEGSSLEREYTK